MRGSPRPIVTGVSNNRVPPSFLPVRRRVTVCTSTYQDSHFCSRDIPGASRSELDADCRRFVALYTQHTFAFATRAQLVYPHVTPLCSRGATTIGHHSPSGLTSSFSFPTPLEKLPSRPPHLPGRRGFRFLLRSMGSPLVFRHGLYLLRDDADDATRPGVVSSVRRLTFDPFSRRSTGESSSFAWTLKTSLILGADIRDAA